MNITSSGKGGRQPPLPEPDSSCADSTSKSNNQRLTFNTASVGCKKTNQAIEMGDRTKMLAERSLNPEIG